MKQNLGQKGEKLAQEYIEKMGYKIKKTNYRCPLGEIDIVALHQGTIVFIEVRTRTSKEYGLPQETINHRKKIKLRQVAQYYLKQYNLLDAVCRFDVISIVWDNHQRSNIEIFPDAFY